MVSTQKIRKGSCRSVSASLGALSATICIIGAFLAIWLPSLREAVDLHCGTGEGGVRVSDTFTSTLVAAPPDAGDHIDTILDKSGSLAPGVKYSTIIKALSDEYLVGEEEEMAWDELERGLKGMQIAEKYGVKPSPAGPLAHATFQSLQDAVLKQYFASNEQKDPWKQLMSALEVMYKLEFADNGGRPIQVEGYPHLYVGSAGVAYNYQALKDTGITHIISATSGVNERFPDSFQYLHIKGVHDYSGPENKLSPYFETTATFMEDARVAGGKVLVHCWEGRSRSVSILIAYLIRHHGLTRDAALARIRRTRPMAQPNDQLMGELEDLERGLRTAKADNDDPLPEETARILDENGFLAEGVQYSTIRRAVLGEYFQPRSKMKAPWNKFTDGLEAMRKAEKRGKIAAKAEKGPLANVSYEQLQKAVLSKYVVSDGKDESNQWDQLYSSLQLMRLMEVDGDPVPIAEKDRRWPLRLFVGSDGAAYNIKALKEVGITHIISVNTFIGKVFPKDFKYLIGSVQDAESKENKLLRHFQTAFDFIEDAVDNGGKVLVHCQTGESSSIAIMTAYLMKSRHLSRDKALAFIRKTRAKAKPSSQYMEELKSYEEELEAR